MKRFFSTLLVLAIVAGTTAFTPYEKGGDLQIVKYSVAHTSTDTYIEVTFNTDKIVPMVVSNDLLTGDDVQLLIESFTRKDLARMVEAPVCDNGQLPVQEEYIGTSFVKLACPIPHCCGPATVTECKTYNPYTHRWQETSCSPWNYE